jgi:SAM-dependent methyltransferase
VAFTVTATARAACRAPNARPMGLTITVTTKDPATSIGEQVAESWLETLHTNAAFDRPWVEQAVDWAITTSMPKLVVDVGCGAGGAARAWAHRLAAGHARVVATDRDPRLLDIALRSAAEEGVDDRISWVLADVDPLPLRPGSVDLVWVSGVIHHLPDQQRAVETLTGLLRLGGRLVVVEGGLPLRALPHEIGLGRPGLEARLDEARARWFVDMRAELNGPPMPYGWPEALARAGLAERRSRSFVAEAAPPLDATGRAIVEQHLRQALTQFGDRLDADDRDTLARLLDPDDPAYIGHRNDLMATAVRTVHTGVVPADT